MNQPLRHIRKDCLAFRVTLYAPCPPCPPWLQFRFGAIQGAQILLRRALAWIDMLFTLASCENCSAANRQTSRNPQMGAAITPLPERTRSG
jgi:hypothetical protein